MNTRIKILASLEEMVAPAHTAVVVVDMQNDFCAEGGYIHKRTGADMSANRPLAERINRLIAAGRAAGAEIVWIQANYEPRFLSGQALAKRARRQIADVCCEGESWGWSFYEVAPDDGEIVIEKHTFSGFHGTELDRLLRFRGIRTLVMTGVATNVCVDSTLRDGYFNGYYIVVPEDCVGSHVQHLHEATLESVSAHFGEVATSAALIGHWTEAASQRVRRAG